MVQNKKTTGIILAILVVAAVGILAIASLTSGDKGGLGTGPSPTAVVPLPGEQDLDVDILKPTQVPKDYTGDTLSFTDDMPDVVFSHNSYFYTQSINLRIFTRYEGTIYYTLDGTTPTTASRRYNAETGIALSASTGDLPTVHNLKAIVVYADGSDSGVFSHGYFLGAKVTERYDMLVFNVSGDPADLTKGPDGIFYGTNYELRGRESERPVYLEVVNGDGSLVNAQPVGVRIYGAFSRQYPQKSMKFFARKSYGSESGSFYLNTFYNPAFDGTNVVRYDKFVLRNSGNDFRFAFIRDELNQTLAIDAGFKDFHSVVPAIAYVNGEYFGFYWLHTTYCDEFFKDRYGASPAEKAAGDGLAFVEGEFVVLEGGETFKNVDDDDELTSTAAEDYIERFNEIIESDLTDEATYLEVREWMDVENYLDYMAFNIVLCNKDWPNNNYKCYRYFPAEGEEFGEGVYDGRWRYLLHDTDYTMGMYDQPEVLANYNTLKEVLKPHSDRYAPLLAALLEREDCQEYFIMKSLDFMNGALSGTNIGRRLGQLHASRASEMSLYYKYLLSTGAEDVSWIDESQLAGYMTQIRTFASTRASHAIAHIKKQFSLGETYRLTIWDAENARFQVNSYLTAEGEDFDGNYFLCYNTTVTPVLKVGTAFDYWEVNGKKVTTETLVLTSSDVDDGKISVKLFTKPTDVKPLYIGGVSANGTDYIIVANRSTQDQDITGYVLSDGNYDYSFPEGTTLAAGTSLVVYCNNFVGDLPEGSHVCIYNLSEGETLTLSAPDGTELESLVIPGLHEGYVYARNWFDLSYLEIKE